MRKHSIGIFDSGFGGLTVFKSIAAQLPEYDYIYLGDNSRAPYGNKSFETVYIYTLQCVNWLIEQGCSLIILACNTASARALRTIQQNDLQQLPQQVKVLGVIRPTAELIGNFSQSNHIGILGTEGTIKSQTYVLEIKKFFPNIAVHQHSCNLWVPFIEELEKDEALFASIIQRDIEALFAQRKEIDTILLGCTHYPIVQKIIERFVPQHVKIISQGAIVASSLSNYLKRHINIERGLAKNQVKQFYTTDDPQKFEALGSRFFGEKTIATNVIIR